MSFLKLFKITGLESTNIGKSSIQIMDMVMRSNATAPEDQVLLGKQFKKTILGTLLRISVMAISPAAILYSPTMYGLSIAFFAPVITLPYAQAMKEKDLRELDSVLIKMLTPENVAKIKEELDKEPENEELKNTLDYFVASKTASP